MAKVTYVDKAGAELEFGDYVRACRQLASTGKDGKPVAAKYVAGRIIEQALVNGVPEVRVAWPHLPGGVLDATWAPAQQCELLVKADGTEPEAPPANG